MKGTERSFQVSFWGEEPAPMFSMLLLPKPFFVDLIGLLVKNQQQINLVSLKVKLVMMLCYHKCLGLNLPIRKQLDSLFSAIATAVITREAQVLGTRLVNPCSEYCTEYYPFLDPLSEGTQALRGYIPLMSIHTARSERGYVNP